jgi:hypothetical protein
LNGHVGYTPEVAGSKTNNIADAAATAVMIAADLARSLPKAARAAPRESTS